MFQCAPFVPNAGMHWRCIACGVRAGATAMAVFRCTARERCGRGWPNRDGAPQTGGHIGGRGCLIRWTPGRMRGGEVGQGARGRLPGIHDVEAEWRGFVAPPGSGAAIGRVRGAARLPIATCRRRRSTPVPGGASSRAPIDARGAVRPSGPAPIYSGLAASASNRPSIYSRAAVAAAGGDRVSRPAARSPGGPHRAACRARGSGRAADIRAAGAARAGPRRRGASRRCRRRRRSIRWRATRSVDSWRVLFSIRGCLTVAGQSAGRVTRAVKAVTVCHGGRASRQRAEAGLPVFLRLTMDVARAARTSRPVYRLTDVF